MLTTRAADGGRPADLVDRQFVATRPNQLWSLDFTYVAFVVDGFAGRIVRWRVATSMRTDFVPDAMEQALYARRGDALTAPSGDACDHALAESATGLFKTEVTRRKGPWRSLDAVECATLAWVGCFNMRRLLGPLGDIPPAGFEAQ